MEKFKKCSCFSSIMTTNQRAIKCPGRFSELREHLHNEAVPLVLEDRTNVHESSLREMWDLVRDEVFHFDVKDPYYTQPEAKKDSLRKEPNLDYLSLVPLFPSTFHFADDLIQKYVASMGNTSDIATLLAKMADKPRRFCQGVLERSPSDIVFPGGKKLVGYEIAANVGIGSTSEGGRSGGGIRSDSPFLLEVYKVENRTTGERNLAGVLGFWPQDNQLLVSQMQSCKNARLPEGLPFGVVMLKMGETAAYLMGFKRMIVYSAREHPIFHEHPNNWSQLGKDFVCQWDSSAKKLGYVGSRSGHYIKEL